MEETKNLENLPEMAVQDQGESFGTLDYVKELYLLALEQNKQDRKKIRLLYGFIAIALAALLTLVISLAVILPSVQAAIADFHAISERLLELDVAALSKDVSQFLSDATRSINSVGDAAGKLENLDIDALNTAIVELTKTVEMLGKMDIDSLNTAIEVFSAAADRLANFRLFG